MKPIIFSTEMVKAILEGRKTQTRRVIKRGDILPAGDYTGEVRESGSWCTNPRTDVVWAGFRSKYGAIGYYACPYGKPGTILWVRETWYPCKHVTTDGETAYLYKATWKPSKAFPNFKPKWKPSIHMPREACRLFLKIKDIRVERVQDISRWDIDAEGCPYRCESDDGLPHKQLLWFCELWDSINEKRGYGWEVNPWVWVLEFERVEI